MFVIIVLMGFMLEGWCLEAEDIATRSLVFYTQNQTEIQARAPQACHDYYRTLLFLGYTIKTTDDAGQKASFEDLLFGMLHTGGHWGWSKTEKADAVSSQIFHRAAYGAFIAHPEKEPHANCLTTSLLKQCKDDATPKTLDDNTSYIYCPELGKWVVLEKVDQERREQWLKYYAAIGKNDFYTIHYKEDKPNNFAKYIKTPEGLTFFRSSLNGGPKDYQHVAYLINQAPSEFSLQRNSLLAIPAKLVDMIVTIYTSSSCKTYSPMGVSRTIEHAKRLYKAEENGEKPSKPSQPESIFFHTLIASLVKAKNTCVEEFWTTPMPQMQTILLSAIYPEKGLRILSRADFSLHPKTAQEIEQKRQEALKGTRATVDETKEKETPWDNVVQSGACSTGYTTIPLSTMLKLLYPHT